MADSYNKKEREKKRKKRKKEKAEKREQRKEAGGPEFEFMYVDEDGNLTSTPPDPNRKSTIKIEDINISTPRQDKSDENPFLKKGTVKFFNDEKGYGFIIDKATKTSIFVHADNLIDDIRDNDRVTFEMGKGPKGPIAVKVQVIKL